MISRRSFSKALAVAPAFGAAAWAQDDYPHKPIRLLVGLAPGGIADITARFIAPRLGEILGRQVVVENRTGAGGAIATRAVAAGGQSRHRLRAGRRLRDDRQGGRRAGDDHRASQFSGTRLR